MGTATSISQHLNVHFDLGVKVEAFLRGGARGGIVVCEASAHAAEASSLCCNL
jgi:hypothetical protein